MRSSREWKEITASLLLGTGQPPPGVNSVSSPVHRNPQRLKAEWPGVSPASGCGPGYNLGQLAGGLTAGLQDGPCDLSRALLLSRAIEQVGQFLLGQVVDQIGCSQRISRIEAHIQGRIRLEGKTPPGSI
jgi:hypothetical protein